MDALNHFDSLSTQLSHSEYMQMLNHVVSMQGRELLSSFLLMWLKDNPHEIQALSTVVSSIIKTRRNQEIKRGAIALETLPSAVLGECASFLHRDELYTLRSLSRRLHSRCRRLPLDLVSKFKRPPEGNLKSPVDSALILSKSLTIPPSIEALEFEWDPMRVAAPLVISDDSKTIELHHSDYFSKVAVSKNAISAECFKSVSWEITLLNSITNFQIGFVHSAAVDSVRMKGKWSGEADRPKECMLWIRPSYFCKYTMGKETKFVGKCEGSNCSKGDRIGITFDFLRRKSTVYYNGEMIGALSDTLPDRINLLMNIAFCTKCTVSGFHAVPRI